MNCFDEFKNSLESVPIRQFPWRQKITPYRILVSEFMLQQTQTTRVIPKFNEWLNQLPTIKSVAKADTAVILKLWQGLGYNRRALNLKRSCEIITSENQGVIPSERKSLENLPGIGTYTAGAIRVFAYNDPAILLETNIRTVLIYHFFDYRNNTISIHDKELHALLEQIILQLDVDDYRKFYYQMMDYGVKLKETVGNLNQHSATHTKQSKFSGSWREKRSLALKAILQKPTSVKSIASNLKIF